MRKNQRGASMLEFSLVMVLVALVAVPTIHATGFQVGDQFACAGTRIFSATETSTPFTRHNRGLYVEGFGWFTCLASDSESSLVGGGGGDFE